jgi:hypothetical protein
MLKGKNQSVLCANKLQTGVPPGNPKKSCRIRVSFHAVWSRDDIESNHDGAAPGFKDFFCTERIR